MKKRDKSQLMADTARVLQDLIHRFANTDGKATKAITVPDFLRLIAAWKELQGEDGVAEVRVKWVGRKTDA